MKKLLLLYSLAHLFLFAAGDDLENYLSEEKNMIFEYQDEANRLRSSVLRKSWINPITLSYQESTTTQPREGDQSDRIYSIGIDQPIFKSGGIYFAVRYANAQELANSAEIEQQRRESIVQAVSILFQLKKMRLQKKQLRLLIKNDTIDIRRKKEQYEAGLIDSSFLDQAIIKRNKDRTSLLELELSEENLRNSFALLSDKNPDKLHLPKLKLISAKEYRKNSIELKIKRGRAVESEYSSKMTWSQYLPSISFYANYYDTDQDIVGMKSSYSTYGLRVTMPISINAPQDIEASRVEYLRSMVELQDSRKKVKNEYRLALKTIRILDRKIALALSDERLYRSLLKTTKEQAQSGEKTKLDVETMQNSMIIARLDAMIYRVEKQIELLKLYEKVSR